MPYPDIPDDVTLLTAAQLFGHLFNYGLFGVLSTQVYIYYVSFPEDRLRLIAFVYGLYVAELVQVIMATHDAYETLGRGWGKTLTLDDPQWLWFDVPLMSGPISAAVQIYFSWRIHVLGKSRLLSGFIVLIALMQGSAGVASGIKAYLAQSLADLQAETSKALIVWLGGSVACDVVIAACMLYFLSKGRQGLATDVLLARLMRITVETGTLTASVASLDLILFLVYKHNNLHLAPGLVLTKIYTNTLIVLLNNRAQMRALIGDQVWMSEECEGELGSCSRTSRRIGPFHQQVTLHRLPSHERESASETGKKMEGDQNIKATSA